MLEFGIYSSVAVLPLEGVSCEDAPVHLAVHLIHHEAIFKL